MQYRSRNDHGSALVPICLMLTLVASISLALAHAGARLIDHARAQTAADAAALAGASGGPAAARRVASRNGAIVVALAETGTRLQVTVRVGTMSASATAALVAA